MDPETLRLVSFIWMKTSTALAVLVGAWALWRGGMAERLGAVIVLLAWFISPVMQTPGPGFDPGLAAVDTVTLLAFVILSFMTKKIWTAFVVAFLSLTVLGHVAALFSDNISLFTYITANSFWGGYAIVFAQIGGMISLERSRRQARNDHRAFPHPKGPRVPPQ